MPGVDIDAVKNVGDSFNGSNILGFLNLFSGGGLQNFAIFSLGIMPYITASIILQLLTVAVPTLEKLQKEGEVGQQKITQYTRYLTVALAAAQSLGFVFLFRTIGRQSGESIVGTLTFGKLFMIVDHAHRRLHAADVDGRADHPARHRQRHLAADLRLDHRGLLPGIQSLVAEPGSGLQGDDAVHRARRDRGDRLHPGRTAADSRPIRQARRGTAHDQRRLDLPAAAREHGRRDPGDLRRVDDGVPAHDRRAHPGQLGPGPLGLLQPQRMAFISGSASSSSSSRTSTRPSRSIPWTRPTTSRSTAGSSRA